MGSLRLNDAAVTWRQVDDDIVAIDLRTSEYVTVTASGRALWLYLAQGTDEEGLVRLLSATASINDAMARRDVRSFLDGMRARGFISESE